MNNTPSSERIHIVLAGACNSGKSSLLNALCDQDVAIVSELEGTTTDPVRKPMELPDAGSCVIVDTPGINDLTELGAQRYERARKEFEQADIVIALVEANDIEFAEKLTDELNKLGVPVIAVRNKSDLYTDDMTAELERAIGMPVICVSSLNGAGIPNLLAAIQCKVDSSERTICGSLVTGGETVLLGIVVCSLQLK